MDFPSKKLYLLVVIFLLLFSIRLFWHFSTKPEQILPKNQPLSFVATVKAEPRLSDTNQIITIADSRIYADFYPRYHVGDRLKIEGEIDETGRLFQPKIDKIGPPSSGKAGLRRIKELGVTGYLSSFRLTISEKIAALLPSKEATLVQGTVMGVDTISPQFRDELIKTGTIHVVVVSGQNLAIVAAIFLSLIKVIGRRAGLILATIAVFSYALLTGFEPPVVRASLMVLAASLATFSGRQSYVLWNLIVAALVIVFIWPDSISSVSFQLTFAATLGIVLLGGFGKSKKLGLVGVLRESAVIAISAYLFTAPIILYYFGTISVISPLVNVLVAELVFPIMVLGFIVVLFLFVPLVPQFLAYVVYVPAFIFVRIVELFSGIGFGQVSIGEGNIVMVIILYTLLIGGVWWLGRNRSNTSYTTNKTY